MNRYTKLSIDLANQKNYLDELFRVYPLEPDTIRSIADEVWTKIESAFNSNDNIALLKTLLELKLFPIKDGYVPYLRKDKSAIERNPRTVNRICGRVRELGLDRLYEKITEPKETNRQMGPLFRQWIASGTLGVKPCEVETFLSSKTDAVLSGSDSVLKDFATSYLGFQRYDGKGLDFIGRFNNKYVIGEAKFITDEDGHQNDQFLDAMTLLKTRSRRDVIKVAILDGVLYIPGKKKMYTSITSKNVNVMSALLLRDFLYSL